MATVSVILQLVHDQLCIHMCQVVSLYSCLWLDLHYFMLWTEIQFTELSNITITYTPFYVLIDLLYAVYKSLGHLASEEE